MSMKIKIINWQSIENGNLTLPKLFWLFSIYTIILTNYIFIVINIVII